MTEWSSPPETILPRSELIARTVLQEFKWTAVNLDWIWVAKSAWQVKDPECSTMLLERQKTNQKYLKVYDSLLIATTVNASAMDHKRPYNTLQLM